MPAMPRPEDKAKRIAYRILGVPANMRGARVTKDGVIVTKGETMGVGSKIDKELTAQETRRLR